MVFEYTIVGGYLNIHKSVFIQEMLAKDSRLRALLNWKTARDFAGKHPLVGEKVKEEIITIDFTHMNVDTHEPPKDILSELKARYREKIKGKVSYRTVFNTYGGIFNYEVDLESEDDEIKFT